MLNQSVHMIIFRKMAEGGDQPFIGNANEYCTRVVYIHTNADGPICSNIRQLLIKRMEDQRWFLQTENASILFCKCSNEADWNPINEIERAIRETKNKYPAADFQYALLRPVHCHNVQDNLRGFNVLFQNRNEDAA